MGFPTGDRYKGTADQNSKLESSYVRKQKFMAEKKVPVWNGEFGPVYDGSGTDEAAEINKERYNLLGQQLKIYDKYKIHWSIWLYKDIGIQGLIPETNSREFN